MTESVIDDRNKAIKRHDLDSGIFQGRYVNFQTGKYTDEFIYGRYQIFEEVMSDLKNLPVNARVLDLGSGTGHLSQFIKEKGFDVTGMEPSHEMLKLAKSNFPEIAFAEGISANIPFKDNEFDYVVCIEVLRYLNKEDIEKTYKEIHRVLKPGGFFMVTHVNKYASDFYYLYYHLLKLVKSVSGKFYHSGYFTKASQEENLLTKAGFSKAESVGRMFGSVRLFYKLGKVAGKVLTKMAEVLDKKQSFKSAPRISLAGHLIVRAYK